MRSSIRISLLSSCVAITCALTPAFAAKHSKPAATPAPAPQQQQPTNTLSTTLQADQKDIDADRTALAKANKEYNDAVDQSPAVIAAKKAVADASAALQAAEDAVKTRLANNADYKAAAANETKLRSELDDLRNGGATQDQISAKATEVFNAGSITSKMERDAQTADPKCVAAQAKLADANTALATARTTAKNDPAVASLKQARDDAQTKLAAAQTKLDTDRKGGATAAAGQ